jgi:mRNA interferase MazF
MPMLLQQADPVFVAGAGHGHQCCGQIPPIAHAHTTWDFVPYRGLQQIQDEIDLRAKLLGQRRKVRVASQEGIDSFLEVRPFPAFGRDGTVRKMLVHERFPARARFIAPRQAEVHGKTDRPTAIMPGDGMVRERIRLFAMMVMVIDIVEQTASMRAQRSIKHQERVRLRTADCLRLLEQRRDATLIDAVLEPRRVREAAGEVGCVRPLQHTAGEVGQTCIGQDDEPCQGMLARVKLAPMLKEIAQDVGVGGHDGSRSHDGTLHEPCALAHREWERTCEYHRDASNGKTQQGRTYMFLRPNRGEIWLANFNPRCGYEHAGACPVLIISTNIFNHGPADLVFVLPLTRTDQRIPMHEPIDPPEGGISARSYIVCDALRAIAKDRLGPRAWGRVSAATLRKVVDNLRILTEL